MGSPWRLPCGVCEDTCVCVHVNTHLSEREKGSRHGSEHGSKMHREVTKIPSLAAGFAVASDRSFQLGTTAA